MRYLSIYEDEYEVRDYFKEKFGEDDEIDDLLSIFEGDPDCLSMNKDWTDYFFIDWENGVVIHTLESFDKDALNVLKSFVEDKEENTWVINNHSNNIYPRIDYRGGSGYFYTTYTLAQTL